MDAQTVLKQRFSDKRGIICDLLRPVFAWLEAKKKLFMHRGAYVQASKKMNMSSLTHGAPRVRMSRNITIVSIKYDNTDGFYILGQSGMVLLACGAQLRDYHNNATECVRQYKDRLGQILIYKRTSYLGTWGYNLCLRPREGGKRPRPFLPAWEKKPLHTEGAYVQA